MHLCKVNEVDVRLKINMFASERSEVLFIVEGNRMGLKKADRRLFANLRLEDTVPNAYVFQFQLIEYCIIFSIFLLSNLKYIMRKNIIPTGIASILFILLTLVTSIVKYIPALFVTDNLEYLVQVLFGTTNKPTITTPIVIICVTFIFAPPGHIALLRAIY